jgi:hypothetical protein
LHAFPCSNDAILGQDNTAAGSEDAVPVLILALAHDRSLTHELYPVCQATASSVVEGCSLVTCSSVDDLAALLDSPRWSAGGRKTVTALRIRHKW